MSFITLKSQAQESGQTQNTADGANNFVNHFNDPVIIRPGDTLELVSCSINRPDTIVIGQTNNEFVFRRGYGLGNEADKMNLNLVIPRFSQHLVKVPFGTYQGDQLAATITTQLQENTLLQSYKDTWTVTFNQAVPPASAYFTFELGAVNPTQPLTQLTLNPSREIALYNELAPTLITDPITGLTEITPTTYTDPFIDTDEFEGRDEDSKLNLNIGLESSGFINPMAGENEVRVKPVCIIENIMIEEPPVAPPEGHVLTFSIPNLGTIEDLTTPGNLSILNPGAPNTYVNGETVSIQFQVDDPNRPQQIPPALYGVLMPTADVVVDAGSGLVTGLSNTTIPCFGYLPTDVFVLARGGAVPAAPCVISAITSDINGTGYSPAGFVNIKSITRFTTPTGALVSYTAVGGSLTDATISPTEAAVLGTGGVKYQVGDLFYVEDSAIGAVTGIVQVASVTAAPPTGDQLVFSNWNEVTGNTQIATPSPIVTGNGWNWELDIEGDPYYMKVLEDGAFVLTEYPGEGVPEEGDGNIWYKAVADPAELAVGKPFNTSCSWKSAFRPAANIPTIHLTSDGGVTLTSCPLSFAFTYPEVQLAYSKHQTQKNSSQTDNPEEKYSKTYSDLSITFKGILNGNQLVINGVQQWGADNNTAFPEANWSEERVLYEDVVAPFSTMVGFLYGASEIIITMAMDNNFNPQMSIGFSNAGVVAGTAFIIDGIVPIPAEYVSNLREAYYPLKAVAFYGEAYPFNVDELNLTNPGGVYGQTRLTFKSEGYTEDDASWRESNRKNLLWVIPSSGPEDGHNWIDDSLQEINTSYTHGNQPIILKFDKIPGHLIQMPSNPPGAPPVFPPIAGNISYFDASPGGADTHNLLFYSTAYPDINNGIATTIGMLPFFQEPTPAPGLGLNGTLDLLFPPRQTIQVEIPEFNIKSWSGGSNDVGRSVGVIPAEQWETNDTLANDTLYYKSDYTKPIELNSQVTLPHYSLSCRLRDTEGRLVEDLQNPTTLTFLLKEGQEVIQQRIMDKAMARASATKANLQENKISTANENMPRF